MTSIHTVAFSIAILHVYYLIHTFFCENAYFIHEVRLKKGAVKFVLQVHLRVNGLLATDSIAKSTLVSLNSLLACSETKSSLILESVGQDDFRVPIPCSTSKKIILVRPGGFYPMNRLYI